MSAARAPERKLLPLTASVVMSNIRTATRQLPHVCCRYPPVATAPQRHVRSLSTQRRAEPAAEGASLSRLDRLMSLGDRIAAQETGSEKTMVQRRRSLWHTKVGQHSPTAFFWLVC